MECEFEIFWIRKKSFFGLTDLLQFTGKWIETISNWVFVVTDEPTSS